MPSIFVLVFLLCLSSFGVALTMGGGPASTTIEVAIYYAFRYDFNLSKAAYFAMVQICLGLAAISISYKFKPPNVPQGGIDRFVVRWDCNQIHVRFIDYMIISLTGTFIFMPILALVFMEFQALLAFAVAWRLLG